MNRIHFLLLLLKAKINITVSRKGMINHMTIIDTPSNPILISAVKADKMRLEKMDGERRRRERRQGIKRNCAKGCDKILQ